MNKLKSLKSYAWILLIIICAPAILKQYVPDSDTFFIAAAGRYIVEHAEIPSVNPFVIHEGFDIVIQQWLFDVIIYGIYETLGNAGLLIYSLSMHGLNTFILYKFSACFSDNKWARAACTTIASFTTITFMVPRPTSVSMSLLICTVYCCIKYQQTKDWKKLIPLPFISLLQINLHATMWVMMFVFMLPFICPYITHIKGFKANIKYWWDHHKYLVYTMAIMFCVGFLNPYGYNGMLYVIESYGVANRIPIAELQSPSLFSPHGAIAFTCFTLIIAYCIKCYKKFLTKADMRTEFTLLYFAAGTFLLLCQHFRSQWCGVIGILPIALILWGNISPPALSKKKEHSSSFIVLVATLSLTASICTGALFATLLPYSPVTTVDTQITPIAAADYLDVYPMRESIKLYTEFNNGAYMEWRGHKVYIDARPELYSTKINNKEDVLQEYIQVQNGDIDYQQFIDKYNFTHLIVKEGTLFEMFLSNHGEYTCDVDGNGYKLFGKLLPVQ